MRPIDRVREYFIGSSEDDEKLLVILQELLSRVSQRRRGSYVGEVQTVDYATLLEQASFPQEMSSEQHVAECIADLFEGIKLWDDPGVQANVVPPTTILSVAGATLSARYNENLISDFYGLSAARSEIIAIGMLADLIQLPKESVGGLFTFGGTGCNLYGARIGIEKADMGARSRGIGRQIHFYCSDIAHYSIKTAAIWTGVGLNNVVTIPSDPENRMNREALAAAMESTLSMGARIGPIFVTMGTTDAFGIDPLREIVTLRDRFEKRVGYRIHIHADAVIGWPFLVFQGQQQIEHVHPTLASAIIEIAGRMSELRLADSIGIDFHKTGWTPYLCSAFLVKDRRDLLLLNRNDEDMPYLYHGGDYHPGRYTLESSRPNYAQKAVINMLLLGRTGYRILLAHLLVVTDHLRDRIEESHDITLLNHHNPAFVTNFRIFPHSKYDNNGVLLVEKEFQDAISDDFTTKINEYNRRIVRQMQINAEESGGAILSYSDSYRITKKQRRLLAVKSYPMSPFIETEHMDQMLEQLYHAKDMVDAAYERQESSNGYRVAEPQTSMSPV